MYVRDALASQGIPFTQDQRFVALGNEEPPASGHRSLPLSSRCVLIPS